MTHIICLWRVARDDDLHAASISYHLSSHKCVTRLMLYVCGKYLAKRRYEASVYCDRRLRAF